MAWTQSDIDTLEDAIRARIAGGGARSVVFSDQQVQFESLADMRALLAQMKREVNAAGRTRFAATSKGT